MALHWGCTAYWLGGVDKHSRRNMACSIGRRFQKTLNSIQSRQIAEMEALLTARSPLQVTNLRGLFGAGRTLQRSIHSKIWCQEGAAHQRHVLSPCTAHQQPSAGSADSQQRRSVATSPNSKQQTMYGGSSASASDSAIMVTAKALDLLRSRDHLQHLGEASAVHEELARLLAQHAEVLQLHSGREQLAVTEADEQVQAVPSGPVMYEGGVAELPHRAVEAGVSLHLTEEARKQELFDLALAGADLGESSQTVDTRSASRLGQASLRPFPSPPANPLETLALLVHEQPEQPSSSAALSAMLRPDATEGSSSNSIGPSVQSRRQHGAAVSTQAIAVGDHLELECSSIASGGQVGSHFHKAQDSTARHLEELAPLSNCESLENTGIVRGSIKCRAAYARALAAGCVQAAQRLHDILRARTARGAPAGARNRHQEELCHCAQAGGAAAAQRCRRGALQALCAGMRRLLPAGTAVCKPAGSQATAGAVS